MNKIGQRCTDEYGNILVKDGDVVENNDVTFTVKDINFSNNLVSIDKNKPFKIKEQCPPYFINCIKQGNYAVVAGCLVFSSFEKEVI